MAMSSVWMSGAGSLARADRMHTQTVDGEEIETIAIYLRIPEPGGPADRNTAGGDPGRAARGLGQPKADEARDGGSQDADVAGDWPADRAPADSARMPDANDSVPDLPSIATAAATPMDATSLPAEPEPHFAARDEAVSTIAPAEAVLMPAEPPPDPIGPPALVGPVLAPAPELPVGPVLASAPAERSTTASPLTAVPPSELASARTPAAPGASAAAESATGSATHPSSSSADSPGTSTHAGAGHTGDPGSDSGAGGEGAGRQGKGAGHGGTGAGEPGAVLRFAPRPAYPAASVRQGEEGRVLCSIHIDTAGWVTRVEVLQSSGHPRLDQAALDALAKWRFLPARTDGRAVACRVPHWVTFRLE